MKWTNELDNKLRELILQFKNFDEITSILNITRSSVKNRCYRLNLKVIFTREVLCKECKNYFICYVNSERIFCGSSCAAKFNNRGKIHSEETKIKIGKSGIGRKVSEETKKKISGENNYAWKGGIGKKIERQEILVKKNNKIEKIFLRKCKFCNEFKIDKKHKAICDDCRFEYYSVYRPLCEFDFDIKLFILLFHINYVFLVYVNYDKLKLHDNLGIMYIF